MALFGTDRDISFIRLINRELMGNIINQQAAFYKHILEQTKTNIYGESADGKFYHDPVLFNCLIERNDQTHPTEERGVELDWQIKFAFLLDDLRDANYVAEVGDIILYNNGFFEVDNVISNQLFMGKDPDYPNVSSNGINPLNAELERFGWNNSVICPCHYVSSDKLGIVKERL